MELRFRKSRYFAIVRFMREKIAYVALAASLALFAPFTVTSSIAQDKAEVPANPVFPSPGEIVAAAKPEEWQTIAASDLLVMNLALDAKGMPRRVVIQLMPAPFSQGWIGNIRKLAAAKYWDGTSINRVQDNYVVQWGDPHAEDDATPDGKEPKPSKAKPLPPGLVKVPESEYEWTPNAQLMPNWWAGGRRHTFNSVYGRDTLPNSSYSYEMADPYAWQFSFIESFAIGLKVVRRTVDNELHFSPIKAWPIHCYGMVGVGRNMSPDTGSGTELYTVIGHAPRHLDRNIALVGRVIQGMEHLSSLPRGTGALGFYEKDEERVPITSVYLMSDLAPDKSQPEYEYLSTESESFAKYADARANRRDPFFNVPAGGADICNIPVPVRRKKPIWE
jgi:cyclophilin family peptidyl-prolyl cis-trans isomerase